MGRTHHIDLVKSLYIARKCTADIIYILIYIYIYIVIYIYVYIKFTLLYVWCY